MCYKVFVLQDGYSALSSDSVMIANGTSTLLKGRYNIIIDTLTSWDKNILINSLRRHGLSCEDIHYVICTHSHSDHIGNNNLFLSAKLHIVGFSISNKDQYNIHPFDEGVPFVIDEDVSVVPTPGHTGEDVSVLVKTKDKGTIAVTGDLFEREEDIENESVWRDIGGSQFPDKQAENRNMIISKADYIIPGHGPMFKVPLKLKLAAKELKS